MKLPAGYGNAIAFSPERAQQWGLNEALVFAYIEDIFSRPELLAHSTEAGVFAGQWWIVRTLADWQAALPFMPEPELARALKHLEELKAIELRALTNTRFAVSLDMPSLKVEQSAELEQNQLNLFDGGKENG